MKKTGALFLKKDNLQLGVVLGALLPVIIFFVIYYLRFSYYPLGEFLDVLQEEPRLVTFISAWCLVANIGLFTLYINSSRYVTARGVFAMTVLYGVLFLLVKVIL